MTTLPLPYQCIVHNYTYHLATELLIEPTAPSLRNDILLPPSPFAIHLNEYILPWSKLSSIDILAVHQVELSLTKCAPMTSQDSGHDGTPQTFQMIDSTISRYYFPISLFIEKQRPVM